MVTGAELDVLIVGAVVAALLLSRRRERPNACGKARRRRVWSPAAALAVVIGLIYLNQVLFTVYVLRVRDGNPAFIARYLPDGWFAISHGAAIETLARHLPAPELLAPSVLRVQAFLELPFVVLAYLLVCRWFSPLAYRRALRLAWPATVAYTATFCLIEWSLHNPYTRDDILIRIAAAAIAPLWLARLPAGSPEFSHRLPNLLAFAVSTAALGVLVLIVYDTALLYNLGHLTAQSPVAAISLVVLGAARFGARLVPDDVPGRGIESIARSFGHLLTLFLLPALPIRYGLGFGAAYASAIGALALAATAMFLGVREAFALIPGRPWIWIGQIIAALAAGVGGMASAVLVPVGHTEARLLWAAEAFFVCAISVCALIDRVAPG